MANLWQTYGEHMAVRFGDGMFSKRNEKSLFSVL